MLGRANIRDSEHSVSRAEGQAHFCDRLCLPPSPFHHLNDFQDIFFKKAGAIKGNNLYILAAYRYFLSKPMNRFDDKDVGHCILLDVFVDWSIVCM